MSFRRCSINIIPHTEGLDKEGKVACLGGDGLRPCSVLLMAGDFSTLTSSEGGHILQAHSAFTSRSQRILPLRIQGPNHGLTDHVTPKLVLTGSSL